MRERVQLIRRDGEQRCHLVDERAGSTRAGAVHADLHRAVEVKYLRVLAAELYDDVRVGYQPLHGKSRRVDLLNKSDSARLSHSHSGGPGHGQDRVARARYVLLYLFQQSERTLGYLREMALVGFVYYIILIVEHDAFERRRPDVKSDSHVHDHTFRINLQC